MPKYIALLRGINVSGVKIIKMEDLRAMFAAMGYKNVQTYIQSGNVIFEAPKKETVKLAKDIEKGLAKALGYDVPVIVRTSEEVVGIMEKNHFKKLKAASEEGVKTYVAFLSAPLSAEQAAYLKALNSDVDTFHLDNGELYIVVNEAKGKSIFTNVFLEKKLKTPMTTRNWNTVCKLAAY